MSDKDADLIKRYDVKMPVVSMAKRTTFVIGPGRKIISVIEGSDAIDPENSIRACTLRPNAKDAGVSHSSSSQPQSQSKPSTTEGK